MGDDSSKKISAMHSQLRSKLASRLQSFLESNAKFEVLYTAPSRPDSPQNSLKTLYILDSSFNPPTNAHGRICLNALIRDKGAKPARFMLCLSTTNADKKMKPASFEDRLVMMALMAQEESYWVPSASESRDRPAVDVAVTKLPYFMDKAQAITDSGVYNEGAQQVHIIGFDTVTRIFNSKYYPEDKKLSVLEPFLSKHRLRASYRDDENADKAKQDEYVEHIGDGSRSDEGVQKEWRQQIELVDDAAEVRGISSTKVREAAKNGDKQTLHELCADEIAKYISDSKFYQNAGRAQDQAL